MEVQKLSRKYVVRKLNDTDIDNIYEVMQGNPQYFQYCPPMATAQSIADDMNALPPRTAYDDKYYIGYFEEEKLVAVMDLILNFPNKETVFIGFFMMNTAYQGKGIGSRAIQLAEDIVKEYSESLYIEVAARNMKAIRLYQRIGYNCLNTITIRKDFHPEKCETISHERIMEMDFEVKRYKE